MTNSLKSLRLALVQMAVGQDKGENIRRATKLISDAKSKGASMIVLPECFNCPYGTKYFPKYAEEVPGGETCRALSDVAKQHEIYLVGGSIPEKDGEKLYNTCTVWSPQGQLLCKHRKVRPDLTGDEMFPFKVDQFVCYQTIHLFDIDIPGGIRFKESDNLSPGNSLTIFNMDSLKIGVGICYDVRFSELSKLYRKRGVDMLLYPGAFNMKTGPLHWELLLRARAVDEQVFVAGISPAQDTAADYVAWGHSMVVDPWGKVITQAEFTEEVVVADLDLQEITNMREQIPTYNQRREDLYDTIGTTKTKL